MRFFLAGIFNRLECEIHVGCHAFNIKSRSVKGEWQFKILSSLEKNY